MVKVPSGLYLATRLVFAAENLWRRLGDLESALLRDELEGQGIEAPIYVAGLARSGTTILTEFLHSHPDVSAHHYSDFPWTFTPYWRNWLLQRTRFVRPRATERAHGDRLMVSADSPEAVEEVLWRHFFDLRGGGEVLGPGDRSVVFDHYYRDHIRKLLLVRGRRRYLAKGNYNIARLEYLLSLFPDARFLIPVREPAAHIASLMRQQRRFLAAADASPRVGRQLAASGHFEFGPGRDCIDFGDADRVSGIRAAWARGEEVLGWARYWDGIHRYVLDSVARSPSLAQAVMFVPYGPMCSEPTAVLGAVLEHCRLDVPAFQEELGRWARRMRAPDYYLPTYSSAERELIAAETAATWERLHRAWGGR